MVIGNSIRPRKHGLVAEYKISININEDINDFQKEKPVKEIKEAKSGCATSIIVLLAATISLFYFL